MAFEVDNDELPTANITPLPTAMTAAAFLGIAWYLSVEVSVRLLSRATRRSLYFWSCLACSWGIITHALLITLLDFKVWESYGAIVIIHLSWCTYVVSQSIVLYSRLNLVLQRLETGRYVLYMIIFNSVIFGLGTVVLGMVARHPTMVHKLGPVNLKWDKIELAAFFIQETIISLLYIRETARHLQNVALLGTNTRTTRRVLYHLIFVNIFIICLDCSLIGLCYAGFFFLQGYYKAAVYAVKLRTEFTILNQLRSSLPGSSEQESDFRVYERSGSRHLGGGGGGVLQSVRRGADSQDSDIQMVVMRSGRHGGITIQKDVVISSTRRDGNDSFEAVRP
ncbi:hypothetical protein N0V95_007417 [Ascochyta clinopodiicola]|nr:hypothetical protein N0V95_007417 [Ascochyta clinopodiicola]